MKRTLLALSLVLPTLAAAPAMASGPIVMGGSSSSSASSASVADMPGRIYSAGGLIFFPRYFSAGHGEVGLAAGAAMPTGAGSMVSQTMPLGLAAAGGRIADGLDWGVMLAAESQGGLRQRYASGDGWSWGGSYLARMNLDTTFMPYYGATYRNELMWTSGMLDLVAQPEVSYFTKGFQYGLGLGADWWATDNFSVGVNYQLRNDIETGTGTENRAGAGAKYVANDHWYLYANGLYLMTRNTATALGGVGYFF